MARANRMGIRLKITVKTTLKSGVAVVKARIVWVNVMNPLPKYRRPAKTPIPLKNLAVRSVFSRLRRQGQ